MRPDADPGIAVAECREVVEEITDGFFFGVAPVAFVAIFFEGVYFHRFTDVEDGALSWGAGVAVWCCLLVVSAAALVQFVLNIKKVGVFQELYRGVGKRVGGNGFGVLVANPYGVGEAEFSVVDEPVTVVAPVVEKGDDRFACRFGLPDGLSFEA